MHRTVYTCGCVSQNILVQLWFHITTTLSLSVLHEHAHLDNVTQTTSHIHKVHGGGGGGGRHSFSHVIDAEMCM